MRSNAEGRGHAPSSTVFKRGQSAGKRESKPAQFSTSVRRVTTVFDHAMLVPVVENDKRRTRQPHAGELVYQVIPGLSKYNVSLKDKSLQMKAECVLCDCEDSR